MSIRLKLTLLYSTILALTLIAFSVLLYIMLQRVTLNIVGNALSDEAQRLLKAKEFRLDRIVVLPASKITAPTTFVQTRTLDGKISDRTDNLEFDNVALPLSEHGLAAVRTGQPWIEIAGLDDGRLLVYSAPITGFNGRSVGIVQVARSLANQDESLGVLKQVLIIGSSLATVAAFGIGWLLAGAGLRPIDRITQTAQAIGRERDFGRRVQHTGPLDEVGRLATTFNTMLAALQSAYKQEEQALQAQRRFVADASHELRTPLTTLRGNIALLQRDPPIDTEDRVAVLADMVDESERMSRLVNDLLALARADAGRPLRREPVPLKPLIEDTCRRVKALAPQQRVECNELVDAAVLGDHDAITQVLLILLDNALKFTPPSGCVNVRTALEGQHVTISVADTGSGIAPEVLPHIFERFYRANTARTGTGTGLGLAIAKTLVEAQQGSISVTSEVGKGSIFSVTLPQAEPRISKH